MATTITGAACTMEEGGKASGAIRRQEDKYKDKHRYKDKHKYKDRDIAQ